MKCSKQRARHLLPASLTRGASLPQLAFAGGQGGLQHRRPGSWRNAIRSEQKLGHWLVTSTRSPPLRCRAVIATASERRSGLSIDTWWAPCWRAKDAKPVVDRLGRAFVATLQARKPRRALASLLWQSPRLPPPPAGSGSAAQASGTCQVITRTWMKLSRREGRLERASNMALIWQALAAPPPYENRPAASCLQGKR